jgi:hypothetical protein
LKKLLCSAIALAALALGTGTAYGAATRAEYVAQTDPICRVGGVQEQAAFKSYTKSIKRYLKHHPELDPDRPSNGVVRLVVRHYGRVLSIERRVNSELSPISPAPGDEAAVADWLRLRTQSADLLDRTVHAFHGRKFKLGIRFYVKSIDRKLRAEAPIGDFGFQYCAPPDAAPDF